MQPAESLEALCNSKLVIEAIVENLDAKRALFSERLAALHADPRQRHHERDVGILCGKARAGDAAFDELRKLARSRLAASSPMTLLDTTALVHESWLRLSGQQSLQVETRRKFFAYAAQVMRTVIVDELRALEAGPLDAPQRSLPSSQRATRCWTGAR